MRKPLRKNSPTPTADLISVPDTCSSHRSSLLWIGAQAIVLLLALWRGGYLKPAYAADSFDYIDLTHYSTFSKHSLSTIRTVGYPLFLKFASLGTGWFGAVPTLQFLAFVSALIVFYFGLTNVGFSKRLSLVLTSSLFYGNVLDPLGLISKLSGLNFVGYGDIPLALLLSDWLALCCSIAAVGILLMVIRQPESRARWVALVLMVVASYQIRAAYLYLLFAIPTLWLISARTLLLGQHFHQHVRRYWRQMALGMFAPFFLFCGFRYLVVGHFGLVSAGGSNMIGVVGHLITPEIIPKLPPSVQQLATEIFKDRDRRGWKAPFEKFPPLVNIVAENYCTLASAIAVPIALRLTGNNDVAANRDLSLLSSSLVRLRPLAYAAWLLRAFLYCVGTTQQSLITLQFLWATFFFVFGVVAWRKWSTKGQAMVRLNSQQLSLLILSTSFLFVIFVLHVALVLLVAAPHARYIIPAAVFLPLLPTALAYVIGQSLEQGT